MDEQISFAALATLPDGTRLGISYCGPTLRVGGRAGLYAMMERIWAGAHPLRQLRALEANLPGLRVHAHEQTYAPAVSPPQAVEPS